MTFTLWQGDCLELMARIEAGSVDTCITDPPYGLSFMGKDWDHGVPGVRFWREVYRVLKPGAMLLAFGGTRTHHRLMVAIEDAGFEIRDVMMWIFGQGFPKSHDISKAINKAAGAEREVVGTRPIAYPDSDCWGVPNSNDNGACHNPSSYNRAGNIENGKRPVTAPATHGAQQWHGYGTVLKPAYEPIIVAMKPLSGTFAANALTHGVAGLWIDGGRIPLNGESPPTGSGDRRNQDKYAQDFYTRSKMWNGGNETPSQGRWPANVLLDEEAAAMLDEQSGERRSSCHVNPSKRVGNGSPVGFMPGDNGSYTVPGVNTYSDTGGASRFFYCAKASRRERNEGLEGMEERATRRHGDTGPSDNAKPNGQKAIIEHNHHPTVKPLDLMRYLCRLTKTPTGGVVLDPFMGSGSTGCAAVLEGRDFIGIELDADYVEIARRRIEAAEREGRQLTLPFMEAPL